MRTFPLPLSLPLAIAAVVLATAAAVTASSATAQSTAPSAVPAAARAPATGGVTAAEVDAHLRFLSSDLLEGRAPATRGGQLTAAYIASELESYGVQPGVNGSFFQQVPIDVVTADPRSISVKATGKATATLDFPTQVVVWPGSATPASSATGEVVFVGYGVRAPEYRWDDFKGANLKGKWLMVLVNDPPAPASEPTLFGGKAMTYYGRWTYKFEEAERQGAAGMLIVHTTDAAGYPWQVVVGSNSREHRLLPRNPKAPAPIGVQGWITDSAATALLAQAGLNLATLRKQAESRDFRPVSTGIMLSASSTNSVKRMQSENVVGVVPGSDASLRNQYVVYSTHWDHLGIGPVVNGDSIYNGADDNASGTAAMLGVARVAQQSARPRRSQLFVFVTAEESGLLGSQYFGENPTVPARNIIANVNVDGATMLGRTRDFTVLGDTKSSLGPAFAALIRPEGLRVTPDANPEKGYFYRSDHFSFARVGVPAVSIGAGDDYADRPAGWGKAQADEYTAMRYHQPSDEYKPGSDLSGAVQVANSAYRFGMSLANSTVLPTWNPDAEFRAIREASLKAASAPGR